MTVKERSTGEAGAQVPSPAWVARMVTIPGPVRVTVEPKRVAGPETRAKVTGRPVLAVAVRANGASPKVRSAGWAKVVV